MPVTEEMLLKPSPNDWLMYSRTYDAQRFSPLNQITTQNVGQLKEVFKQELPQRRQESIPIVYRGVMYIAAAGQRRPRRRRDDRRADLGAQAGIGRRVEGQDDRHLRRHGLQQHGGRLHRGARRPHRRAALGDEVVRRLTAGTIVVEGKVMTGRACAPKREDCYIAAHDAKTGKEVWRFYTAAGLERTGRRHVGRRARRDARGIHVGDCPAATIRSRRLIYWGVANPTPNTRANRHGGNSNAVPTESPADLYSNSTIALDPDTGKLRGTTSTCPATTGTRTTRTSARCSARRRSRSEVREVDQPRRQARRAARRHRHGRRGWRYLRASIAATGQFLWANPFPFDTPDFLISNIDGKTGSVLLNKNKLFTRPVRSPRDLLLEHPQLLAAGLSPGRTRCSSPTSRTAST